MSEHICTPETCPNGGNYFVSAVDGDKTYYMAGPYKVHAEALAMVDDVRNLAIQHDKTGRAWFLAWGTVRVHDMHPLQRGSLNRMKLL